MLSNIGKAFLVILAGLMLGWSIWMLVLFRQESQACHPAGAPAQGDGALQDVLERASAARDGIGLQAAVILPDGARLSAAAGYADLEHKCWLTPAHHLQVGSLTKLYTAALVMEQVERGALALDDPISRWLDLPYGDAVSVRMLLNHTSGIPDYSWDAGFLARLFGLPGKRWKPAELVRVIQRKPFGFSPGVQHEYSNSNYLLLGLILERATGRTYDELLHDAIAAPLGLGDTFYQAIPPGTAIASGYDEALLRLGRRNLTGLRPAWRSAAFAAGGILSTAEDVAGFTHGLFTGRVVGEEHAARMLAAVPAPDADLPEQVGYGLGVRRLRIGGEDLAGHTGTFPGYSGIAMHHPEQGYTIVVLSNLSTIEQAEIVGEILTQMGDLR